MQNRVKNRTLSEKKRNPTVLQDTVPTEHAIAIVDIQIVNTWKVSFWIPFPKPKRNLEKCQRWIRACGRELFTVEKVTRWTYICSKHFVGGQGPTDLHPDPIPATYTPFQVWQNIVVIRLHEKVPISISKKYIVFFITK